jgi:hypothetical protein
MSPIRKAMEKIAETPGIHAPSPGPPGKIAGRDPDA